LRRSTRLFWFSAIIHYRAIEKPSYFTLLLASATNLAPAHINDSYFIKKPSGLEVPSSIWRSAVEIPTYLWKTPSLAALIARMGREIMIAL
jgi:hypothetical protein